MSLNVTDNKVQLIDIILTCIIIKHYKDHLCNNTLVITGSETVPNEGTMGVHNQIHDMANSHEETDVIVVNQVMSAARQGRKTIHVVCDDTLCLCFYSFLKNTANYQSNNHGSDIIKQDCGQYWRHSKET